MNRRLFFGALIGVVPIARVPPTPIRSTVRHWTPVYANERIAKGERIVFENGETTIASTDYCPACQIMYEDYPPSLRVPGRDRA